MAFKTNSTLLDRLPLALLLLLCAILTFACADHSFDINPNPSPEASTSLICPNDNPTDCYPALFQPTIHFQKIRPDQTLPPGLHVRLNIQTGEKEARLNVPEESESVSNAVVVIDDVAPEQEASGWGSTVEPDSLKLRLQDGPRQEKHARSYTPPRSAARAAPYEDDVYAHSVSIVQQRAFENGRPVKVHDEDIILALETLTELAHSLEWGLTICQDVELSRTLFTSIGAVTTGDLEQTNSEIRSAALLLMATAIQNNQDALSALLAVAHHENGHQGPLQATLQSLALESGRENSNPNIIARTIFLLSQLCANDKVLAAYLSSEIKNSSEMLGLFAMTASKEDAGSAKIRHRISNFVEDHAEQSAAILQSHGKEVMENEMDTSLRPWCNAFTLAMQRHEDGVMEFLEAKKEVSRVLETYTGQGCASSESFNGQQEL